MGSYLGIPECLGGSKTKIFGFLQERMHTKVNGCTVIYLTKGGKEVLIKSVETAMLSHAMSCFCLLEATTSKLTTIVSQF